MSTFFLKGGGFHGFWYHLGYVQYMRSIHGPDSFACCGSSAGSLAAWVLAHDNVSKDAIERISIHLLSTLPRFSSLDTWVSMFMHAVTLRCGLFRPFLYMGAYVTSPTSRTPVLLRTENVRSDLRESCFIPILSGALCGPRGFWDGSLGFAPILPPEMVPVDTPGMCIPMCLLPSERHIDQYDHGSNDAECNTRDGNKVPRGAHAQNTRSAQGPCTGLSDSSI
jgi:hypothetical protein